MTPIQRARAAFDWRFIPERQLARARPARDPGLEDVYLRRGLVLIHIPKNAGTTVEDALFGYRVRHRTWEEVREDCPEAWGSLPKVAVIRDPVDRFLSAFDYLRGGGRNALDRKFGAAMIGRQSLDGFVDRLSRSARFRSTVMGYFHFRPQTDYVCDSGEVVVDHLIPLHALKDGLGKVAGLSPEALGHSNRTPGSRTREDRVSPETRDTIRRLYEGDVDLFQRACATWGEPRGAAPQ